MNLASFLTPESVEGGLESGDRRGVLTELSSLLVKAGHVPEGTDLVTILENREELGSTGVGEGVAIPHVRLRNISSPRIAVGRSVGGVDFGAVDGRPVHLFFLTVSPESSAGDHLKALARISRLLKKPSVRQALMEAKGRREMYEIVVAEDGKE